MEQFGVYSEVGKLRKVIVHRPELSLKRLTPTNHDDLLFDDVLWVERAQWEHDQFVAAMRGPRDRGLLPRRTCSARRWRPAKRPGTRSSTWLPPSTPSAGRWSTRCARACGT